MSIHSFSKPEFVKTAKDILLHNEFIFLRNADKLTEQSSFNDVHDITSLDIAALIGDLEEKYHVDMEWVLLIGIDSIDDVYNVFIQSIYRMRQSFINKQAAQKNALIK